MHEASGKLRQLQAALRLRVLQREKAEMERERKLQALRAQQTEMDGLVGQYEARMVVLRQIKMLDPALHEQRLLAQMSMRAEIDACQKKLEVAREEHRLSLEAQMARKREEEVMHKACERVSASIRLHRDGLELIDIFDSRRGGVTHGL